MAHDVDNGVFKGRLTLTSATPVTATDVTTASTIYLTPYNGNQVALYDGVSSWSTYPLSEISLALGTLTSGLTYDVFLYNSAGVGLTLEKLAWTNSSNRATSVVLQNGVYSRSDSLTHRYAGTFYAVNTANTEDSKKNRFLYNLYNQVPRQGYVQDTTDHTYGSATTRYWNNNTSNKIQVVLGFPTTTNVNLMADVDPATLGGSTPVSRGLLDWTGSGGGDGYNEDFVIVAVASQLLNRLAQNAVNARAIGAGYHAIAFTEEDAASGTSEFIAGGITTTWLI